MEKYKPFYSLNFKERDKLFKIEVSMDAYFDFK